MPRLPDQFVMAEWRHQFPNKQPPHNIYKAPLRTSLEAAYRARQHYKGKSFDVKLAQAGDME